MGLLRRFGNKTKLLPQLLELFPRDVTAFIDLFFGSGAVTFAMVDRCKHVIANDSDADIFNLFMVLKEHKDELIDAVQMMPIHESLLKHWKTQEEADPVWRAVRFLMLSNFGHMGKPNTLRIETGDSKGCVLTQIKKTFEHIAHVQFMSTDFRSALPQIAWRMETDKLGAFIYSDPPYIGTDNNYQDSFTEQDTQDLFDLLVGSGIRFALSEFDNPFILELAHKHGLQVTILGERRTLKSRQTEIVITNYDVTPKQTTFSY
jgi:DNA adenine methylase